MTEVCTFLRVIIFSLALVYASLNSESAQLVYKKGMIR